MFLADLNIYSTFSDGKLSIPKIVDLYGSRGFGAIAITDHLCESTTLLGKAQVYMNRTLLPAVFPLYMEILRSEAERAWKQYRMVLIPGFDLTKSSVISHRSAHILGLGVSKYVSADGDEVQLARAIRDQGGLAIAGKTHHLWDRREQLRGEFDAWEVARGKSLANKILASGLPTLASSGMHSPRRLTSWKSVFFCERDQDAILDAIRRQDLCFKYYSGEVVDDVHHWADLGDERDLRDRVEPVRHVVVPQALPVQLARADHGRYAESSLYS